MRQGSGTGDQGSAGAKGAEGAKGAAGARVIAITSRDNVATALDALMPGQIVEVNGLAIEVRDEIPGGHKIALSRIVKGAEVVKYGSPIGSATADIEPGAHVHVHNVASGRGRGDLQ